MSQDAVVTESTEDIKLTLKRALSAMGSLRYSLVAISTVALLCVVLDSTNEARATPPTAQLSGLVQTATGVTKLDDTNVDARPLTSVYRARFWVQGAWEQRASYMVHFAYDRLGADEFALLQGKPLSSARSPAVQDIILHLNVLPKQRLILTTGFFRPTVGQENNTVVIKTVTLEPALTSTLVRRGTVEQGHGRSAGANLGSRIDLGELSLQLHLGMFMPTVSGSLDDLSYQQSVGTQRSALISGAMRLVWGKRDQLKNGNLLFFTSPTQEGRAVHVGASGAYQGATDRFRESQVVTAFASAHLGGALLDGEWVNAKRFNRDGVVVSNQAWHARVAYNIQLGAHTLTPFALYSALSGAQVSEDAWRGERSALNLFAGSGALWDAGVQLFIDDYKLRLGLHLMRATIEDTEVSELPMKSGMSGLLTVHMHI